MGSMRAAVCSRYGDAENVKLETVPTPKIRKKGEVLVRVHAASMNKGDWHLLHG